MTECGQIVKELQELEERKWKELDHYDKIEKAIHGRLQEAVHLHPNCLEAFLLLGDFQAKRLAYSDSMLSESKKTFLKGLQFHLESHELKARLAYIHDVIDSIHIAKKYYVEVKDSGSTFIDVKSQLFKFTFNDSLKANFLAHPVESYLHFERTPTHTFRDTPRAFCKIWGSGKVEYFDYFGDSELPIKFESKLSRSELATFLELLENIRFATLINPYKSSTISIAADFNYVAQWHLPNYKITYHTPWFSHWLIIYGLGTIYGEHAVRDVLSITHIPSLNKPFKSFVMTKIDSLAYLWGKAFSTKYILDEIDNIYGPVEYPLWGPSNYIYHKASDSFMRLSLPNLKVKWQTKRKDNMPSKKRGDRENVIFYVAKRLYGVDRNRGQIAFIQEWDSQDVPYFRFTASNFYLGKLISEEATLYEYEITDGDHVRTAFSQSKGAQFSIIEGVEPTSDEKEQLRREFKNMYSFYDTKPNEN